MSIFFSRRENLFSVYLPTVDTVGRSLLQRVGALLEKRPDLDRGRFGQAIGRPTPSWISEFFNGKRTTNDLRLVLRMARVLRVPVCYLLSDGVEAQDAATLTLLGAWRELTRPQDREAVLTLALTLRPAPPEHPGPDEAHDETASAKPRTSSQAGEGTKRKRRD